MGVLEARNVALDEWYCVPCHMPWPGKTLVWAESIVGALDRCDPLFAASERLRARAEKAEARWARLQETTFRFAGLKTVKAGRDTLVEVPGRLVYDGLPEVPLVEDPEASIDRGKVARGIEAMQERHGLTDQQVETLSGLLAPCPCGGPEGHVPGGLLCRRA